MTTRYRIPCLILTAGLFGVPSLASAHEGYDPGWPGTRVAVSVEVDGRPSPLYPAPDGSGKRYLEAREGACYAVRLDNRTGERVGVVLTVDGLNAISGVQASPQASGSHERMYILDPWGSTTVRGWRTSLAEVRRFTFVDERSSYAARSGKANGKMGWIEIAVYRERRPVARQPWEPRVSGEAGSSGSPGSENEAAKDATGRAAPPASLAPAPEARAQSSRDAARAPLSGSYPGTGWGGATDDRAELVTFDPLAQPVEIATLRYEYAGALRALGILPRPYWSQDRLRDRESGGGFAQPPAW
jgi:hypothetical protein